MSATSSRVRTGPTPATWAGPGRRAGRPTGRRARGAVRATMRLGARGGRAVTAETCTFDNVRLATQACAQYFLSTTQTPVLVVGYDTRSASDRFARAVAEV